VDVSVVCDRNKFIKCSIGGGIIAHLYIGGGAGLNSFAAPFGRGASAGGGYIIDLYSRNAFVLYRKIVVNRFPLGDLSRSVAPQQAGQQCFVLSDCPQRLPEKQG
jgi:hypothetical protein